MKSKTIIPFLALAAIGMAVAACIAIQGNKVTLLQTTAKGTLELEANWTLHQCENWASEENALCAILVPAAWTDFEEKAVIVGSSQDLGAAAIPFSPVDPNTVPNPDKWGSDNIGSWYLKNIGFQDNKYGDMQWHFFSTGNTEYQVPAGGSADFTVHVTYPTDAVEDNYVFNLCIGLMAYQSGPDPWWYNTEDDGSTLRTGVAEMTVRVKMTGGASTHDFVNAPAVSTIPSKIHLGDIFCVQYASDAGGEKSALDDVDKVYLCARATLADGRQVVNETPTAKSLMEKQGTSLYARYIYPGDFFGLPKGTRITALEVWFCNADKSIVVAADSPYTISPVD